MHYKGLEEKGKKAQGQNDSSQTFHIIAGKDVIFALIFSILSFIFLITVQRVFFLKSGSWATHTLNNL